MIDNWRWADVPCYLRTGKALRGSPRDAMIADAVAPEQRGKAFGFHCSADTLGAAVGPLLAIAVLAATAGNLRAVFGWTLAPGLLSLIVAVAFLRDPRRRERQRIAQARSVAARSATRITMRFHPPGRCGSPDGIGRDPDAPGPLSSTWKFPSDTLANAGGT